MTFYSALLPPDQADGPDARPVMVACRLSWLVLVAGWLGLVLRGCIISGFVAGGGFILLRQVLPLTLALPLLAGGHLFLALNAAELRQWELRLRGYRPARGVYATGPQAALLRWMEQNRARSLPSVS
ncbi:hypothetical protein SXCC_04067 [Gluconacetobacter sp. SXCC-1]|uniref:hypothetical protein n=1 Tax=Komagataeibacter rhaeticus TaxID=215221 RepID=UPI000207F8AF|nr:hypothetical protein [Komagataeibacter rhaeticus]ATU72161.1 hypothetical protein CT154_04145 [Komagataeibacter xylinus]EGG75157.1 hypothetical protein SXCC_04067 [Gluconacetobacter sp. SXCC-1]WPP21874.1 hypothetical protein SCD25_15980 [Komagataeibacter rhaeticus]